MLVPRLLKHSGRLNIGLRPRLCTSQAPQPVNPSSGEEPDRKPGTRTFQGWYEGLFTKSHELTLSVTDRTVDEIEKTLTYPVTVVGTRKEGRARFWAWDFNAAFIKDRLNHDVFLTFKDQKGIVRS